MLQNKVRTTVYLPKGLVEAIKMEAISRGTTLTGILQKGAEREIGAKETKKKKFVWGGFNLGLRGKWKREWAYE
ncbi:MAG: hypothetical protein AAB909_04275 [Patescibacteria group bacterium]